MTLEYGQALDDELLDAALARFGERLSIAAVPSRELELADLTIVMATVELPRAEVRRLVPSSLGLPRPGLGRVVGITAQSPTGPIALGLLTTVTRTEIVMRSWVVDAVTSRDGAAAAAVIGPVARDGAVDLVASSDEVNLSIDVDGEVTVRLDLRPTAISAELTPVDPIVHPHLVTASEGRQLLLLESRLELIDATAGVDHEFSLTVAGASAGHPWGSLLSSAWRVTGVVLAAPRAMITVDAFVGPVDRLVTTRY